MRRMTGHQGGAAARQFYARMREAIINRKRIPASGSGHCRMRGIQGNTGRKFAYAGIAAAMLLSVWGILYPELYLNPDVIRIIPGEGQETEAAGPDAYAGFLDADSGQITVKWKLAELLGHCLQEGSKSREGAGKEQGQQYE